MSICNTAIDRSMVVHLYLISSKGYLIRGWPYLISSWPDLTNFILIEEAFIRILGTLKNSLLANYV